jgi:hypothetical protein
LNVLLFDPRSEWIRVNDISALNTNRLADKTSIPYLMVALRDPDQQGSVGFGAYVILHRLIPSLGAFRSEAYFKEHREEEIRAVESWWTDELAGKHSGAQ